MTVFHTDSQSKAESGRNTSDIAANTTAGAAGTDAGTGTVNQTVIWDRKRDGGFPGMFFIFIFCFCFFIIWMYAMLHVYPR